MQTSQELTDVKPELALPVLEKALRGEGAFLLAGCENSRPNPMTIGWATLGAVWGKPNLSVYVRPTRYTHGLMETARKFSVNVPAGGSLSKALALCGSKSGRDLDKLGACGLKTLPGRENGVFVLEGCALYFECVVGAVSRIEKESLSPEVAENFYPRGDYHSVYHGIVLHCYGRGGDEH